MIGNALHSKNESTISQMEVDVCVYTTTPSGILAAVAVAREGRSVVIVEPGRWVGGILGSGIKPLQDCPNHAATGGLTKQLLLTLGQPDPEGERIRNHEMQLADIRDDFQELLNQHAIQVIHDHRINRCIKEGEAIREVVFDLAPFDKLGCPPENALKPDSLRVKAGIFIDASYEGDMMARAGVSYRVGRESADEFNEKLGGVRGPVELTPIDPFVEPGNPDSGLLKWVENDHGKAVGSADHYTQAYNYRYYVTDDPTKRAPITPPEHYRPEDYELVGRYVEYLKKEFPNEEEFFIRLSRIFPGWQNDGEYNYHRKSLITAAPVGISYLLADGDHVVTARVWKQHQDYLRGLHQFMSTDPRVPLAFRQKTAALGLDITHHPETHGWPHQLYIRVSRRMEGRYTLTADDVYNRTEVEDPICLAQYGIDVYPCRRIWIEREGQVFVALEGWMFVGGAEGPTQIPYPIPYRAITPSEQECSNLLVPICFSATHLAYASARMEPAFMICGEAAGIAACQALQEQVSVQQIDPDAYREALERAGMVLEWQGLSDLE